MRTNYEVFPPQTIRLHRREIPAFYAAPSIQTPAISNGNFVCYGDYDSTFFFNHQHTPYIQQMHRFRGGCEDVSLGFNTQGCIRV